MKTDLKHSAFCFTGVCIFFTFVRMRKVCVLVRGSDYSQTNVDKSDNYQSNLYLEYSVRKDQYPLYDIMFGFYKWRSTSSDFLVPPVDGAIILKACTQEQFYNNNEAQI